MGDRREKFHEAMGRMSFRVRHQVAGKEVVEYEVLRGATEHATAYPCEIQINPGELLDKVMSAFDEVDISYADRLAGRDEADLLPIGVDVAKDPDHFVVTVICPCGSRATISSRTMTVAELSFVEYWTKAHDGHGEVGH